MYISHCPFPFIYHGHLGCFHVLGIVTRAGMSMEVPTSLQGPDFNSLDKYTEVGLIDHMVLLCLIF